MGRAEPIERASAGYELASRRVVVLSGKAATCYASRDDMKERFAEAQVEPDRLAGVLFAVDKCDPKWQAVLLVEKPECCTVSIVKCDRSETVASVSFTMTH